MAKKKRTSLDSILPPVKADKPAADASRETTDETSAKSKPTRKQLAVLLDDLPPGDARGLRDALLWHDFVRASLYCRQNRRQAVQQTLADALQLAPQDVTLRALASECRLPVP